MPSPEHLGDGAYVSETDEGVAILANQHDPYKASHVVFIQEEDVHKLIAWLEKYEKER